MQCSKHKKMFARADNLKRHKCKLDQETECSPDSNDVTTEQPTDKDLSNAFADDAYCVDEPRTKKRCLKENSTNQAPDERHKSKY